MTKTHGIGDNSGLTDEEREALAFRHSEAVRLKLAEIEPLQDMVSAAKKQLSKLFKVAEAEGFPRKEIEDALKKAATPIFVQRQQEQTRNIIRRARGLVAGQLDMFNNVPAPSRDELDWETEGYRVGLRAGDPDPRKYGCPPGMDPAFMRGWHDGQARNGRYMEIAQKVDERRAQPFGRSSDADAANEAEDGGDQIDLEDAIDEAAEKLRSSSFMDTTAPEDVADGEEFGVEGDDEFMAQVREVVGEEEPA